MACCIGKHLEQDFEASSTVYVVICLFNVTPKCNYLQPRKGAKLLNIYIYIYVE